MRLLQILTEVNRDLATFAPEAPSSLFIGSELETDQQHVPQVELQRTGLPSVPFEHF